MSYYYFFFYQKKPGYEQKINELSEEKFFEYLKKFQNLQTAYIGGVPWFLDIDKTVTEKVFETAKHNLEFKYNTFGIQENMDLTFTQLQKHSPTWFLLDNIQLQHLNKRKSVENDVLTGTKLEQFNKHNIYDIELYDFAKELFFKRNTNTTKNLTT